MAAFPAGWSNYKIAYAKLWFSKFVVNSSLVAILATAGHIFSCALTGYAFARYKFRFKGVMFGIVILSMIVPAQVIIFLLGVAGFVCSPAGADVLRLWAFGRILYLPVPPVFLGAAL